MSQGRGTILVGYDGSPEADLALQWAAETAALDGRPVRSVTVDNRESSRYASQPPVSKDQITARVDAILDAAGVSGTVDVTSGHAVSVLLRYARRTDLLVVGSRGLGRASETLLGSVSQHLVRHAACPVVVLRAPARPDVARIVVGVDGSDESLAALEFACRRATLTKESVVALNAWKPSPVHADQQGQVPTALAERGQAAEASLAEYVIGVQADNPDVTVEREAVALAPALALTGSIRQRLAPRDWIAWTWRVRRPAAGIGQPRCASTGAMSCRSRPMRARSEPAEVAAKYGRSRTRTGRRYILRLVFVGWESPMPIPDHNTSSV